MKRRNDIPLEARDRRGLPRYGKTTGHFIDDDKYPLDWAKCGSRTNYRAHLRRGQEPCRACKQAEYFRPGRRVNRH